MVSLDPDLDPNKKTDTHVLLEIWNEFRGDLPECEKATPSRIRDAEKLWSEHPNREYWVGVMKKLHQSEFLTGKTGKWQANVDWFLRPDSKRKPASHLKISEGQYGASESKPRIRKADL